MIHRRSTSVQGKKVIPAEVGVLETVGGSRQERDHCCCCFVSLVHSESSACREKFALVTTARMWYDLRSGGHETRICDQPRDISGVDRRARRGRARVFTSHEPQQKGQAKKPVRAAFFQKRSIMGALRGSNPEKLTFILILVPTRFLFHARFRFERRNPRLERRCLDPFVTGVPP